MRHTWLLDWRIWSSRIEGLLSTLPLPASESTELDGEAEAVEVVSIWMLR